MSTFDNHVELSTNKNSLLSAFLLLFFSFIGAYVVGYSIGGLAGYLFFDGSFDEYLNIVTQMTTDNRYKIPAYVMQGVSAISGFILVPALFMVMYERQTINVFFLKKSPIILFVLTAVIALSFIGFNSWFIEWNANITFPDTLAGFETMARSMENKAMELTAYLTYFDIPAVFLLAFIVIAVVPGIGEELVFRGFLQNYFHKTFNNIHVGIWLSAILFSAIHLQFFGFVPRMLLGALFGYLYYWSGNLLMPIIAHTINNGFMLIMMYMYQLNYVESSMLDLENPESVPISMVAISGAITFGLLYYFRKINLNSSTNE